MSENSLSPFFNQNEDLDMNFNLEHIYLPSDTQEFLNSIPFSSNNRISDSLTFDHDVFDEFLNVPSPDSQNSVSNDFDFVSTVYLNDSVSVDLVNHSESGKSVDFENFGGKSDDSVNLGGERVNLEKNCVKSVDLEKFGGEKVDSENFGSKRVNLEKKSDKSVDSEKFGGKRVDSETFVSPVTDLINDSISGEKVNSEISVLNCPKTGKMVNSEKSVLNDSISDKRVVDSENSMLNVSKSGKMVDFESSVLNGLKNGERVNSENCGSNDLISSKRVESDNSLSPESNLSNNSVSPSLDVIKELNSGEVDQKIKVEEGSNDNLVLKRKKGCENSDLLEVSKKSKYRKSNYELKKGIEKSSYSEARTSKNRKPSENEIFDEKQEKGSENSDYSSKFRKTSDVENGTSGNMDVDEKRKVRLIRNRESAQLSRQRKKHYVEELEDKVRLMHSTIVDLNNRVSYVMAENASLRQQVTGGKYPWVPFPPYMVKPQGSQVPLVPIPRLKVKKSESRSKTKKVASVSLLGLLFFMMLFGGLMPIMNVKFREMNESVSGGLDHLNNSVFYYRQKGRVLTSVNGSDKDIGIGIENDFIRKGCFGKTKPDGEKERGNSSEPLVASLFVPRNDKLVKIDGNLIIHSVMASEKAMASNRIEEVKSSEETGLAVARNNVPSIIPLTGNNRNSHPYRGSAERPRALGGEKDKLIPADGKLQQWFKEGLAGPMLSSGMCTEVFQFDVSPEPGAIVPATSAVNVSSEIQHRNNITRKVNRRILHGIPVPLGFESNITEKPAGIDPEKNKFGRNSSLSSMVVSVLVDPREAGDGDGVMGPKSVSRIFVVVLIDSVKYVTYSCMLPLIGSGAHLVTT